MCNVKSCFDISLYVKGGLGVKYENLNTILKYNPTSNEWEKTGELVSARFFHAVAVLPLKEVKPYCSF